MENLMECMCLQCGVSTYLDASRISVEDPLDSKLIGNCFCPSCGGVLTLVGKVGDEPHYRLK